MNDKYSKYVHTHEHDEIQLLLCQVCFCPAKVEVFGEGCGLSQK